MNETLYTAHVTVRGGRDGSIRSSDGALDARLAFQKALGGDGRGTNPEQLFAAGYGACFASTVAFVARAAGTPLASVEVDAEVDMLRDPATGAFDLAVRLGVRATGQERAVIERLVEQAREACPYSRATRHTIATTVEVRA